MTNDQVTYWTEYYEKLAQTAAHYLDYSNDRVQAQSLAAAIEAAGAVFGKRCLDVGCGCGLLSRSLRSLGATRVVGLDVSHTMIERNRASSPEIEWHAGPLASLPRGNGFDRVFLVEMLQYVPLQETLELAWSHLVPDGRLIAIVPNRDCPIVRRAIDRFDQRFAPPTPEEMACVASSLPGARWWGLRGMQFQVDQSLCPYAFTEWTREPRWSPPPNRIELALCREPLT